MILEYRVRCMFKVINISADKVFESIRSELEDKPYQVILTTCDTKNHIEVIERMIKFVKERIYVIQLAMPFKMIPKQFIIEIVHHVIILISYLLCKEGLHIVLFSREIVVGKEFRCPKICIGQYVQRL